jgi:hypothetical protein
MRRYSTPKKEVDRSEVSRKSAPFGLLVQVFLMSSVRSCSYLQSLFESSFRKCDVGTGLTGGSFLLTFETQQKSHSQEDQRCRRHAADCSIPGLCTCMQFSRRSTSAEQQLLFIEEEKT